MSLRTITLSLHMIIPVLLLLVGCTTTERVTNKERARVLQDMGVSLVDQGNPRAGLGQLLKAQELDPENAELHDALGRVYRDLIEYDLSLLHFNTALKIRPDFSDAQNNLGTLYLLMREWDLAIESFQKALDNLLYETPEDAYYNMGLAYFNKGEFENAVLSFLKALKAFPAYTKCLMHLGLAYKQLKRWDKAIDAYKRAIRYEPEQPPPYLLLGRLQYELGNRSEARDALKRFLSLVSEGLYAQEARKLLQEMDKP